MTIVSRKQAAQAILRAVSETLDRAARDAGVDLVRLDDGDVRIWHKDGNEAADIIAALTKVTE